MVFENEEVFNSESLEMKKDSKKSQEIWWKILKLKV